MEKKIYTIDATGGKLGRVATKAANFLTGKNLVTYSRNTYPNVQVIIENAGKLDIFEGKLKTDYVRYSGYPGGIHYKTMEQLIEKKGKSAVLKIAVDGMLPHNKLKSRIIRNLKITE